MTWCLFNNAESIGPSDAEEAHRDERDDDASHNEAFLAAVEAEIKAQKKLRPALSLDQIADLEEADERDSGIGSTRRKLHEDINEWEDNS